jgi:hypothetical protein
VIPVPAVIQLSLQHLRVARTGRQTRTRC